MKRHSWILLALGLVVSAGPARASDNIGLGGTITYTDASGLNPRSSPPYLGGYVVHSFTNTGATNLYVPFVPVTGDVLVVAGGGGGGGKTGGGGGAGGYIYSNGYVIGSANTSLTNGGGGAGGSGTSWGTDGSNSLFGSLVAIGGGGGAPNSGTSQGRSGGSGGGSSGGSTNLNGGAGTSGQGMDGGACRYWGNPYTTGGGGGAGSVGTNGTATILGHGGMGKSNAISGVTAWYAGGGGGGILNFSGGGSGGSGVGGSGAGQTVTNATSGQANTGGGGGGMGQNNVVLQAGSGGSGLVIVRYPYQFFPLSLALSGPANGQIFPAGSSVTATATVANGTAPYAVTFYTNSAVAWSTNGASTTLFSINLGVLAGGTYTNYATVTDGVFSNATSATNTFTVAPDTTPPTPNPMTFAVPPAARDTTSIVMTATTATDAVSPPVEYYFENTTNSVSSGWISSTVWTNAGLTMGTTYGYRVRARDAVSNATDLSAVFDAVPAAPTLTWDANGTGANRTDGTGNWLDANQWWNGLGNCDWDNSIPNNAVIGIGGAGGTITLGTVIAGRVTFTNFTGTYTLSGGSLNQSGGIAVAANAGAVAISTPIGGSGGIAKSGNSTLTLSGANTYSGDTIINAGVLDVSGLGTTPLSNSSGVTFTGNSTFIYVLGSTLPAMIVNSGVTAQVNNASSGGNTGSAMPSLSGGGTFSADNPGGTGQGKGITFGDLSAFTGMLQITLTGAGMYFQMPNLNDTVASSIRFTGGPGDPPTPQRFIYTGSSPLTLSNRAFEVAVNSSGAQVKIVNNGSGVFTINKDLIVTAPNAKTLSLGGSNTGTNTFAGAITNGTSAVISLTKADVGKWILTGSNTFSGGTTVSAGTLEVGGAGVLGGGAYAASIANNATFRYNSSATQTLGGAISGTGVLIKDGAGALTLAGTNTYSGATTIRGGALWGVTVGACANSAVTVTNAPGGTVALGVRVTDSARQWTCASLAFSTADAGAQLHFSFDVAPGTTLAPLNITGDLTFNGAPLVVVNATGLAEGQYPLLVAGGSGPSAVPALRVVGYTGSCHPYLYWGGPGNKTLFLLFPTGTVLTVR